MISTVMHPHSRTLGALGKRNLALLGLALASWVQAARASLPEVAGTLKAVETAAFWSEELVAEALVSPTAVSQPAASRQAQAPIPAAVSREIRDISGWQVLIQTKLLETERNATEHALGLLQKMLDEIVRVVPPAAVKELRQIPLYFSPAYQPSRTGAEYHPDAGWLRANGRDPMMARAVEFSGVADFEKEMNRMPNFVLHELAHGYHHRVLEDGFANAAIKQAYDRAKAGGKYELVERWFGNGKPNTRERAYAMTNPMEYFAEATEAYFVRNDFFPFTRDELKLHDPEMLALLEKLWTKQ